MLSLQKVLAAVACIAICIPAAAQAPSGGQRPLENQMPAGAMGFLVVDNVRATMDKAHAYLRDIGLAQMLLPPDADLVESLKGSSQLGEGFNPDGSFGIVLLNPEPLGIDVEQLARADETGQEPKLPFVMYIPGSGVREVFPSHPIEMEGRFQRVQFPAGPMYATHSGGHVMISPMPEALEAAVNSTSGTSALDDQQAQRFREADAGVFINFEVAGPVIIKMLDSKQRQLEAQPPDQLDEGEQTMLRVFEFYKRIIPQMQDVQLLARFAPESLRFDEFARFKPQSELGRMVASAKPGESLPLDRLVNISYAMAMGASSGEGSGELSGEWIDSMLANVPDVSEATRRRMRDNLMELGEQVREWQFVVGQAPPGAGILGMSLVMQVRDPAKAREILSDIADTLQEGMNQSDDENFRNVTITHNANSVQVAGVQADVVEVNHPAISEPDMQGHISLVLGEERVRVLIMPAGDNRLVLTLGGAQEYASAALEAARQGSGDIPQDDDVQAVMKDMPSKPTSVFLLNGANMWRLSARLQQSEGEDAQQMPQMIQTNRPLAIAAATQDSTIHAAMSIPNVLVREMIQAALGMAAPPAREPATQDTGAEAF